MSWHPPIPPNQKPWRARPCQSVRSAPTSPQEFAKFVAEDRQTGAALIQLAKTPREDFKPPEPGKK